MAAQKMGYISGTSAYKYDCRYEQGRKSNRGEKRNNGRAAIIEYRPANKVYRSSRFEEFVGTDAYENLMGDQRMSLTKVESIVTGAVLTFGAIALPLVGMLL